MTKAKILHIIDGGFLGGGQKYITHILEFSDHNLFEHLVAAKGGENFEQSVSSFDVKFYNVYLPKLLRTKYLKPLEAINRVENFDIVHSHGGIGGFYGRILKKHFPALRSVHTIHGIHYVHRSNPLSKQFSMAVEQYLVQFTDMTICVAQSDLVSSLKYKIADENKVTVILNGIDHSKLVNRKKNLELLFKLGLNESDFVIGNISRFDIQKNQDVIVESAYYLKEKFPNIKIVLVGDGIELNRIKNFVARNDLDKMIRFTGEVENPEDYYSLFDLFIMPSFWEGMPYVLLEAMASRLPIICSNIPNHLEILKDNFSALTFEPSDPIDLFRKIKRVYENEILCQRIAENALMESTQYEASEKVKLIEDVYKKVLGK